MTEPRTDPVPADAAIDYDRITQVMGDFMAEDPGWHHDLEYNELAWSFAGWDEHGQGSVGVIHKRTGQAVASARVHWSALAL